MEKLYRLIIESDGYNDFECCITLEKGPLPLEELLQELNYCSACRTQNWRLEEA